MNKRIIALLFFCICLYLPVRAQIIADPMISVYYADCENCKKLYIAGSLFSNPAINIPSSAYFIPLQFSGEKFYEPISAKMGEEELFAQDFEGTLFYSIPLNKENGTAHQNISFYLRAYAEQKAYMTKDAFQLLIKGNKDFAGEKLILDPFLYHSYAYQEFSLNYNSLKMISENKSIAWGVGLSLLNGAFFNELEMEHGSFYTSATGDSIHAELSFEWIQTDPDQKEFTSSNGFGGALNLHLFYQFENGNSLYSSVRNLGFIDWNKKGLHYQVDTSIAYNGIDIVNSNPFAEAGILDFDSLLVNYEVPDRSRHRYYLAPELNVHFQIHHVFDNANLNMGLVYRIAPHYVPRTFVNLQYKIGHHAYIQPGVNFDQFKNLGLCFEMGLGLKDRMHIKIGTNHLEGLGLYGVNGQGVYVDLGALF
ncbi:MAG: hypothetical protein ISR55_08600 [Bacteroidetes bacterium]|nr:hypothetical protein [Bacteroidota bacterium]